MTTTTLPRTIARTLGHNVLAVLVLTTVLMGGLATQDKVSVDRPAAEGSAHALVDAHRCDNPEAPTHAVITDTQGVTRYVGKRLTDQAVEQAVFGIDHGLTVHAFCR